MVLLLRVLPLVLIVFETSALTTINSVSILLSITQAPSVDINDIVYSGTSDAIFIAGSAQGTIYGSTFIGGEDMFVSRFSSTGLHSWTQMYGFSGSDYGEIIGLDTLNNVYFAGYTQGNLAGNTACGNTDVLFAKYPASGASTTYAKYHCAANADRVNQFLIDLPSNLVVLVGTFDGKSSYWRARADTGVVISVQPMDGEIYNAIAFGASTDVILLGGHTYNTVAPEFPFYGLNDYLIRRVKLSTNEIIWTSQYGTSAADTITSIVYDSQRDQVIAVGTTEGSIKTNVYSGTGRDVFIVALDYATGALKWRNQFAGNDDDEATSVTFIPGTSELFVVGTTATNNYLSTGTNPGTRGFLVQVNPVNGNRQTITPAASITMSSSFVKITWAGDGVAFICGGNQIFKVSYIDPTASSSLAGIPSSSIAMSSSISISRSISRSVSPSLAAPSSSLVTSNSPSSSLVENPQSSLIQNSVSSAASPAILIAISLSNSNLNIASSVLPSPSSSIVANSASVLLFASSMKRYSSQSTMSASPTIDDNLSRTPVFRQTSSSALSSATLKIPWQNFVTQSLASTQSFGRVVPGLPPGLPIRSSSSLVVSESLSSADDSMQFASTLTRKLSSTTRLTVIKEEKSAWSQVKPVLGILILVLISALAFIALLCMAYRRLSKPVIRSKSTNQSDSIDPNDTDFSFRQTTMGAVNPDGTSMSTSTMVNDSTVLAIPGFLEFTDSSDYRIEKQIGKGGFSTVYIGTATSAELSMQAGDQKIVIKRMTRVESSKAHDAFIQEITILNALKKHKNISKIFGYSQNPPSILMKYYRYGHLSKFLQNKATPKSKYIITSFALDIVNGLQHIHEKGLAHNDIKPENILLDNDENDRIFCVISDFGIAQIVSRSAPVVDGFRHVLEFGASVAYASPQALKSLRKKEMFLTSQLPKNDIYSMAIM
eukprot:Partr_v1_DN28711_c3_g1_i2_m61923 putative Unc51-like kinase